MKKLGVFFLLVALSQGLFGQNNDSIVQKKEESTPSIQDELWKRIETLSLQVNEKERIITRQKADSAALQSTILQQQKRIEELENTVANANASADKANKDFETIKQAVLSKDAVLYKQCLLYPLERRYNPSLITDAMNTVNVFAGLGEMSDKFEEYKNTYQPLLMQYEQYNTQLTLFIQGCIDYIEKREEKLGESGQVSIPKEKWLNELKALSYYQECYVGKDTPPYRSIIYLDEIIDEFKVVVGHGDNVRTELQKLIKKLEPKKN